MPYHIVTTRFNPMTQTFKMDDINQFEMNKRILFKEVSFFEHDKEHYWSIFFEYEVIALHKDKDKNEITSLTESQQAVYEKLKQWRNETAQKEGIPPYVIAKNNDMIFMLENKITTYEALRQIRGFGDKKIEKYGRDMLAILSNFYNETS